jgi:hypothetical protein
MWPFGEEEDEGGRGLYFGWMDMWVGFELRVAQLCRLEAYALWGEVTLPEVLCSWWEMQAMPHLLTFKRWHTVCVAAFLNYPRYERTVCGALRPFKSLRMFDSKRL